ncbi:hypothetical protein ACHAPT_009136 [Fusarium lateritium]
MSDNTRQTNTPDGQPSPSERLYTTATPIRFAPRSAYSNMPDGGSVMMLDPRNVQQRQLDACAARRDETTSQMAKYKRRVEEVEFLVEDSTSNSKSEGQTAPLHDELKMLREELGKMVVAQQQQTKKGGWFPWKTSLFVLVVGLVFLSSQPKESLF